MEHLVALRSFPASHKSAVHTSIPSLNCIYEYKPTPVLKTQIAMAVDSDSHNLNLIVHLFSLNNNKATWGISYSQLTVNSECSSTNQLYNLTHNELKTIKINPPSGQNFWMLCWTSCRSNGLRYTSTLTHGWVLKELARWSETFKKQNWKLLAEIWKKYIDGPLVKGTEYEDNSIPLNLIRAYHWGCSQ